MTTIICHCPAPSSTGAINIVLRNCCLVSLLSAVLSQACLAQLPSELSELAEEYDCREIPNFSDSFSDVTNPPYAYGYLEGEREDSVVFWCERDTDGYDKYRLVVHSKVEGLLQCPATFDTSNYPGGLSIVRNPVLPLSLFWNVEDRERGPHVYVKGNFIKSDKGGTSTTFYCHKGKWLVYLQH